MGNENVATSAQLAQWKIHSFSALTYFLNMASIKIKN